MTTYYCVTESPIGRLLLTSDGEALTRLYLDGDRAAEIVEPGWVQSEDAAPLPLARRQLADYFEGRLRKFDLPMHLIGTPFQRRVWQELTAIPYGSTISYGELARRIGEPGASRAVGLANGRNPIAIVVPCHRVIGANGKLVGFGGGLPRKAALLSLEGCGSIPGL